MQMEIQCNTSFIINEKSKCYLSKKISYKNYSHLLIKILLKISFNSIPLLEYLTCVFTFISSHYYFAIPCHHASQLVHFIILLINIHLLDLSYFLRNTYFTNIRYQLNFVALSNHWSI